jgi:hypothetical protein
VVYLCDWLPPEFGAVGQYAAQAAEALARGGAEVTLVGLSSAAASVEERAVGAGSLRVVRVRRPQVERAAFGRRAAWTLATHLALMRRAWSAMRHADEIVFTGSPPLGLHWIVPANLLLRRRLVYRITDFHPECLIAELGGPAAAPLWLRGLRRWTVLLRRRVAAFEVLGEDQRRRLLDDGVAPERIVLRRDDAPVAVEPGLEPLPRPPGLDGRRLLLYSGNFGVAHDDATFVEGFRRHHAAGGRVALWLNATGAKADRVERRLRELGLPFHRSTPVPLERLARLLATPDAHLVTLRDEFVGYVLPSKVYGCIASGRPVLFVGSAESDVDLLCRERLPPERYRRAAVGDADAVASALDALEAGDLRALRPLR